MPANSTHFALGGCNSSLTKSLCPMQLGAMPSMQTHVESGRHRVRRTEVGDAQRHEIKGRELKTAPPPVRSRRRDALARLTALNLALLLALWFLQESIGEANRFTALLVYVPQHGFGLLTALLALVALRRKRRKLLALNAAALVFFVCHFLGLRLGWGASRQASVAMTSGTTLRVMSYNINYGRRGAARIAAVVRRERPDVLCLQETNYFRGEPDPVPEIARRLPGWHMARGIEVTTFSRFPIVARRLHPMPQPAKRNLLETTLDVRGRRLRVFNIHMSTAPLPPAVRRSRFLLFRWGGSAAMRAAQISILTRVIEAEAETGDAGVAQRTPFVVLGDFNNPPRGRLYRRMSRNWTDAFAAAGRGLGYTFRSELPLMRIDYVWAGPGLGVTRCHAPGARASDHRPVVADLSLPLAPLPLAS